MDETYLFMFFFFVSDFGCWNVKKSGQVVCGGGRLGLFRLLLLRMGSPNCEVVVRLTYIKSHFYNEANTYLVSEQASVAGHYDVAEVGNVLFYPWQVGRVVRQAIAIFG